MIPLVRCSFYDYDAPIYTMSRFLPPSKVADATISNSILGDGTVIRAGSKISHSVVGLRSLIQENCIVEDTLLMGSDYYETLEECALIPGCLPMGLGKLASWACLAYSVRCQHKHCLLYKRSLICPQGRKNCQCPSTFCVSQCPMMPAVTCGVRRLQFLHCAA